MAHIDETRLLAKLSWMYYQQEMTQAQIAAHIGMSRQKVQRLLRKARITGVVDILIKPMTGAFGDLERALEVRYGLKDVVVTETQGYDNPTLVTQEIAAAGAEYLCGVIRSRDKIVVAWGVNVKYTVDALYHHPRPQVKDVEVIQGFGGLGDANDEEHITIITQRLAACLGASGFIMPAPAVAGSAASQKAFCTDPSISFVLDAARNADLLITGIGSPASAERMLSACNTSHPEISGMPTTGIAGDINLRYFDRQGRRVPTEFDERIIGLTLDDFRKIKMVVALAGGADKFEPLSAALKGAFVNVVITDHVTATRLLEQPPS